MDVSSPSLAEHSRVEMDQNPGQLPDDMRGGQMAVDMRGGLMADNDTGGACYCGKPRALGSVELQCAMCSKWFHAECIGCYLGPCLPFMCNYMYTCKKCTTSGMETFNRKAATYQHACYTALANLTCQYREHQRTLFSKDRDIIPFIDKQWETLTSTQRRVKTTWHNTIYRTLAKETELFSCAEPAVGDPHFGLINPNLYKVSPAFEILTKGSTVIESGKKPGTVADSKMRGTKRKVQPDNVQPANQKLKRGEMLCATKLVPLGYPSEHPFNKDGYRYVLAEPDPHAPNRQAFDESIEWAGKPIPGYLYRTYLGSDVLLALHDRAPQLKVSEDRLSVTGEKGYSMIRASHGVKRGSWYYEVTIDEMPDVSATRIGWSQALGNLQAPCGYDKFSYSWRSRKGTIFHQSRGKHYHTHDGTGYKEGDTVGVLIVLPQPTDPSKLLPPTYKDKPLVKFKNHLYYEEKDYMAETERNLQLSESSSISFYKNGKCQGVAFENLFEGTYFPCISLYKSTKIAFNFGPDFKHTPDKIPTFRPMSDAASQMMVENALADTIYHVENEGKLPEF